MKIRRLEIQGFKSFADRMKFDFGDGITAVVGPNGCGKSNVVDAVKWVLGDMSPKSLRGKRMEDVIFAGSSGRKPAGMAEVSLILDNQDGSLPTEHAEVEITRRLYRTGESEYLLNGEAGRLKDIRELFLDTGLGAEGHSIMEQGQIDALLRANSVDRRGIFEEAAGVSRYKQRKKESEAKLLKTGENLERLRDVMELEEKRLRSLKAQASRARRYRELCEELKQKKVAAAVLRWRTITAERGDLEARIDAVRTKEAAAATDLAGLESEASRREGERETARSRVHELEAAIAQAAGDARAAEDRIAYARRTIDDLRARTIAAARLAEESVAKADALDPDAAAADAEAAAERERSQALDLQVARVEAELAALAQEADARRSTHEGAKRAVLDLLHRVSKARNEETERRTEARQAEARLARLAEQRTDLHARLVRVEGEATELAAAAARMDEDAASGGQALAASEEARAAHADEAEAAERRRSTLAEERAKKAERLDVLKRLAAAFEGVDGGAKHVLEEAGKRPDRGGVLGLLADLIEASKEGAHVLDRMLGHAAGAVVVRTTADALRWLEWLKGRGGARARFLALDLAKDVAGPLPADVGPVRAEPDVLRLVASAANGCLLVPDLATGIAAWQAAPAGMNAVTPTGDRVTASGALVVRAGRGLAGPRRARGGGPSPDRRRARARDRGRGGALGGRRRAPGDAHGRRDGAAPAPGARASGGRPLAPRRDARADGEGARAPDRRGRRGDRRGPRARAAARHGVGRRGPGGGRGGRSRRRARRRGGERRGGDERVRRARDAHQGRRRAAHGGEARRGRREGADRRRLRARGPRAPRRPAAARARRRRARRVRRAHRAGGRRARSRSPRPSPCSATATAPVAATATSCARPAGRSRPSSAASWRRARAPPRSRPCTSACAPSSTTSGVARPSTACASRRWSSR